MVPEPPSRRHGLLIWLPPPPGRSSRFDYLLVLDAVDDGLSDVNQLTVLLLRHLRQLLERGVDWVVAPLPSEILNRRGALTSI